MPHDDQARLLTLLGNTGSRYERTRHNVGWMLEARLGVDEGSWQRKFKGVWQKVSIAGEQVVILKPHTMMNLSGEAVQAAARFFRYAAEEIAVVHDDVEIGFGEVGVRLGGGLAGHNGLRSVAHCLGTREFWRVRIGVGRPHHGELHGHVLGRFTPDEESELPGILRAVEQLLERGYREGFAGLPARVSYRDLEQS